MLISFQIFTTNAQVQSQFLNKSYITPIENLVSWDYQELESLDNQQNVKITNDYSNEIMCPYYEKCQGDYLCQQQVEAYYFDDPNQIDLAYDALQYISFSNPQLYLWSSLTELQKQKLIKHFIFKSVQQSISYNSRFLDVQSKAIYINFEDDGIMIFNNYQISLQFTSIDNSYFGGPFDCTRVNGQFKKYKFTNVDQFEGFYKKDLNNVSCIQPGSDECQCSYYNAKRLFPVEWRCRPWYIIGAQNYMTYTNPYIDAFTGATMASATIRLLNQTNLNQGIDFEFIPQINNTLLAVFGIDINLQKLQLNIQLQSSQNEYSYIIAPSQPVPLQPQLYNEYQAISHPQISPNDTNILDLEFSNSTNKQQEVEQYMQQLGSIFTNRIYQFNVLIDSGNIKTQYELKVVLQAINQAVLSFKSQIAKQIDDLQKCNIQRQIEIYQRAVQDFTIFQNKQGLALCYNNLSNLSVQCNQLQEGIVYSQQCNLISEQMYNQIKQKYLLGQSDQQKLSNICMDQSFQGFMKLHACRKYTLAKLLIKFIVSQKGTQKNQVYLDLYQKMKNLVPQNQIVNSNEKIEVNQFGFNSMSLQYQQKISTQLKQSNFLKESEQNLFASREQFFSQRRYQIDQESNMNQNLISEYSVKIQDKKFILSQACELLYECRFIMKKIAESNKSRNQIKVIKGFTVQILALQELVQCHNLMKNRYVVIKEIIKAIKTELEQLEIIIQRKNNYKHILIPFQILIQKYYTIQGQYYLKKKKYPKSLRNYLKGLNYIQNQDSQQICNDTNKYDVFNTIDCLKGIQKIININQIPLDSNQKAYLDQDFQNLTLQSQEKYNLYFEEAFFDQHQLKKVTIIQQQDSLESYFEQTYKNYIQITALSQSKQTIFSFQQETTSIQMIGNFNKQMILNANNFNNIVNWEDQFLERGNYGDGKYNFLISNEYVLDDYCNLLHKECQDYDLQCINLFSQRQKQFIPNLTEMMYKQYQYQSWSSALQMQWEQLAQDQQIKIILTSLSASITKALTVNSKVKEIGVESYYIAFQSDGIFLSNELGLRIQEIDILNQPYYDGPFNCTKNSNGQYNKYKFTDPSQFNGFQFMDNNGNLCKGGICSCQYYNIKRLVPLDWRCRPWFYSSYKEYQITFSAPYSDLSTNSSDTTITYKITQNQNDYNIKQEKNMETIAVQSVDLDLSQVKLRLSKNQNNTLEYSYIVSPKTFNYDENQGYYQLLAMIHPLSNGTIQNITDIEFQNSTNKEQEVNEYLQNVNFMLNTEIRGLGSGKILQNESTFKTIKKNGQNYLTYFSTLRVSYGNLYTQENIIFGYLARVISTEVITNQLNIVVLTFKPMKIALFLTYSSCLIFNAIALSILLAQLLRYNFDIPINILNQLICKSQIYEIHTFSDMIRKGQIKTQQELKNLIFAIDSVIYFIENQVQTILKQQNDIKEQDLIEIYKKALINFQTLNNLTGVGICQNNISNLYHLQGDFQLSIQYMQKAILTIEEQLNAIKKRENFCLTKMCYKIKYKNIMKIYASRNYQLANLLINNCQIAKQETFIKNQQIFQEPSETNLNGSEFIKNDLLSPNRAESSYYHSSSQNLSKGIKREFFYSKKYFIKNQNSSIQNNFSISQNYYNQQPQAQIDNDKKIILAQAIDLLWESQQIFNILSDLHSNDSDANELRSLNILTILLIAEAHKLKGKNNYIIQEILIKTKIKLLQYSNFKNFKKYPLYNIIWSSYYIQKAFINREMSNLNLSLINILKSLNYQMGHSHYSAKFGSYDYNICYQSLLSLQILIEDLNILLTLYQKQKLKHDIQYFRQRSTESQSLLLIDEFFFQGQEICKKNTKKKCANSALNIKYEKKQKKSQSFGYILNDRVSSIKVIKKFNQVELKCTMKSVNKSTLKKLFGLSEKKTRFLNIFLPYLIPLITGVFLQLFLINYFYLSFMQISKFEGEKIVSRQEYYFQNYNSQHNLEQYFEQTFQCYISIVNLSQSKQTINSFQQSTTQAQILGIFNKIMALNIEKYTDIIAWHDQVLDQGNYQDKRYNFFLNSEYDIDNWCNLREQFCGDNDQNCFNQFYQETESLSPYENQIAYSQYSKFKFTDPEQFDGFQFKDKDGETYSEPYTDIVSYTLDTTITYKITDNKNPKDIQLERQMPTIAVQSIDTDLSQVQNRLSSSYNISQEYSYIISAKTFNYEQNSGYYEYLTLTHPLINGTVKSILDLEFVNSTNKQQEISDYINQTSFIQNTNLRSFGCQQIHYSDNQFRKIIKNGQEYLTYFQTLRVCYGNLYDQESIIFGYIARAFSTDLIKQQLAIVTQTFKPIQTKILITYLLCFIFNAILLSYLLLYLLKFNFDIPISIVNQFISRAQTYEIHQFSESIKQKKIKTQHELQNLIFAIESVISFVQIQIQQLHKDKNDIQQNDLIKIYQEALTNFQILDNLTGVGICYNNISNLYLSLQDYEKSIQAMKSALLTIEILLSSKKKKTQKSPIEMAQKIKHKNIIKIYASRNFQLANLLLRYLKKNNSDNKQTLHHLPLDDHNLDIENSLNLCHSRFQDIPCLKQQENLSLEISFSQNIFQSASRENFFSRKFFTKCQNFQWYNHSQNIILNESKLQIKDTKNKIIIAQAIDLLWEAQKIFNLLAQTYQKSEDLQDNLESYFDQTYKNYIAIVNLSEQKQTISSFQQSTTYQQIIALFNKNMVLNTDNFTQIIAWEDFYLDQKSYPDGKYNFLISNEFIIDNYCSLIQKNCPLNETNCQKELDNYLQNDLDSDQSDLIYQTGQYSSWSSSQQFKWEELTDQQKMKIILVNFSASISKSFLANLFLTEIEIFAFYIAFQQDGIFVQNEFNMRLNQIDLINNPDFGGPFNCTQDFQGKYSQYRYSDPSQFDGFQYMDTDGERCTGSCSCEYFNVKRLFPIEWRCRPWFISSQKEYQITFSEPYSDLSTNASDTTITYKITDNINIMNLTQEQKMIPIAVQSIDLDLRKIKQRLSLNKDFSLEYSYIVAPKTFDYDDNQGYYQLLAMTHPLNNGTVQSILDIEFQNSTNRQEEINKYLTQVQFMLNTNIRQPGCNSIFQTQNVLETIIRNGQEYLTYFSTLRVCYGNLYTQENLIIGYLAKAISTEIIQSQADIVIKAFQPMQRAIIIAYIICFILNAIFLSLLLGVFLQYNFDNPINILNSFINKAKPNEINQFSERISQGQIKTQQELKNLIFAINSVITFVESQIQSLLRDQKEIQENDLIQIYLKAQKNFETFENFTGIGICYNNISNLHRLLKEQQLSIEFMQKAILNIEHQLLQIKKEQFIELQDMYQKKKYKSILKIYASRNFSLANLLIECCKNQQQITSKNKLDEVINNFQMINNLTNQNTNFDEQYPLNLQNLSNQQPVAQNSNQLINRDKFYSIKYFYKNQQTCKRQSKQFQFGDFQQQNKNILVQAIDLLWEAQQIFNNLSDLYFYSRDIDECRFCNIICILLIIEASRLMQKKGCLINEMLKKCKNLIVYYKQFPSFRLHPLYDIVWNQYFFQKAVLNRQLHKLEKSLKYCLKSLGFRDNISSSSLQEQISYDYQDVHESLTFLSQLLEECDITLTPNQQEIIKYDLNYFKSASIQNEIRNQAKWIQQINLNLVTLLSSQRIALVNVMYINTQILFKFHGFQYMNSDRDECNGQCSCKYFNMKRLFRLYRRWRPWFLAIFQYVLDWFSNSFSDNTITYKLIDNLDMMNMTQEEILMDSNTTLIFQQIYLFHSQISQTS
ncbi:hypothetical protein ABPG73_010210 [Tetrahymena malaccensis]